ncbi:MAG: sensor histidine kinase [Leadbetterella sp.]
MKIGTRITLQFTILVAIILGVFSISFYYLIESYTKKEFLKYLTDRAKTTASLFIKEKSIDKRLLRYYDRNTLSSLYAVEIIVFDENDKVKHFNTENDTSITYNPELLLKIRKKNVYNTEYKNKVVVGLMYKDSNTEQDFLILAQSEDIYGKEKLEKIKDAIYIGLSSAILLTVVLGFFFSWQALKPISRLNNEISKITANNLNKKLSVGQSKDEIASLARNFNAMLSRLEKAFLVQKSFVSNASHELRTPLAAMKSEIQIALEHDRTIDDYKEILETLNTDNSRLVKLTNGLLQLAKSDEGESNIRKENVRIDEVLFEVQDEILHSWPEYRIQIDFESIPEEENFLVILGNKDLLKTLFTNLMENGCKYSDDKTVHVNLRFNNINSIIAIKDNGIGISESEKESIFEPFYRTKNVGKAEGHGIGLSICKKITEIHKGRIGVKSKVGVGSVFSVILPHV